jgi:2-oxo-4-hydroxy-4-carboxy--5-ureidoimidazoline (OHCU) decarboxylase
MMDLSTQQLQPALRAAGKPHYLAHPHLYELTGEEQEALRREQFNQSVAQARDFPTYTVEKAFQGTPIHIAQKVDEKVTKALLIALLMETVDSVKVPHKLETPDEFERCYRAVTAFMDFTIEDFRLIMERVRSGTIKRYNKFEQSDMVEYFVQYAEQKAEVREKAIHNATKQKEQEFANAFAEYVGDFRTPEERERDRNKGPQSLAELMAGRTSISPYERAQMRERDSLRRFEADQPEQNEVD